jgi:hypothetical protein
MSMSRECHIVYLGSKEKFYLFLAVREHGDIREHEAECFGPFDSREDAEAYLDGFSNPGGITFYIVCDATQLPLDHQKLLAKAQSPDMLH